jgi:hypothetical protein
MFAQISKRYNWMAIKNEKKYIQLLEHCVIWTNEVLKDRFSKVLNLTAWSCPIGSSEPPPQDQCLRDFLPPPYLSSPQPRPCPATMDYNSIHGPGISNFSSPSPRKSFPPGIKLRLSLAYQLQIACQRSQQRKLYKTSSHHQRVVSPRGCGSLMLLCKIGRCWLMESHSMGACHVERWRRSGVHPVLARPLLGKCLTISQFELSDGDIVCSWLPVLYMLVRVLFG